MYDIDTTDVRRFFAAAWNNRHTPNPDALEGKVRDIIAAHPEYHRILDNIDNYVDHNWLPENGQTNPFLHMSLHLSIREQAAIDQPFGIRDIYEKLCVRVGTLEAEHRMMEALAHTVWKAQRYGGGLDVNEYMTALRALVGLGAEDTARLNPHEVNP